MCGRYTLRTPVSELQAEFELTAAPAELVERFNIAPTQPVPVVLNGGERALELVRWGLIPFWAKDAKIGSTMINARSETLADKPAFKDSLKRKRCLVLADGFYEWAPAPAAPPEPPPAQGSLFEAPTPKPPKVKKGAAGKTPMHIRKQSRKPFAFAGLWDTWRQSDGTFLKSCTIITTTANALMSRFHDRMPVILAPEQYDAWLNPEEVELADALEFVKPYALDDLEAFPVSSLVNSVKNDVAECLTPS
jgi:putative SOS response-associated peptidase YedK